MTLQKSKDRISIGGGHFYVKDYAETPDPIFRTIGYCQETQLAWTPDTEEVHDETGELVAVPVGNDTAVAKPVNLQTTKAEIDLILTLQNKRIAVLYLVPYAVFGVKKIQRYEFSEVRILPKFETTFNASKRTLPLEFRIMPQDTDVWGDEIAGDVGFWGRSDITFELSDIPLGTS